MTATSEGTDDAVETPDLDAVGDNHMPEDMRVAERRSSTPSGESEEGRDAESPDQDHDQDESPG